MTGLTGFQYFAISRSAAINIPGTRQEAQREGRSPGPEGLRKSAESNTAGRRTGQAGYGVWEAFRKNLLFRGSKVEGTDHAAS